MVARLETQAAKHMIMKDAFPIMIQASLAWEPPYVVSGQLQRRQWK